MRRLLDAISTTQTLETEPNIDEKCYTAVCIAIALLPNLVIVYCVGSLCDSLFQRFLNKAHITVVRNHTFMVIYLTNLFHSIC